MATTAFDLAALGRAGANAALIAQMNSRLNITSISGLAIPLINKTGAASVKGTVVSNSSTNDNSFNIQTNEFDAIGVVFESGIADGQPCWVVISGVAEVLLKNGTASTRGNWAKASDVDGRCDASLAVPSAPGSIAEINEHFKEIGHCLESKTAGTNVLAKCILHFN